jgi:NhaP-type Na+/H+ and K+/H+ antiporter
MYDAFGERPGGSEECRPAGGQACTPDTFWGFTLSGSAKLKEVARFYGFDVPGLEAHLTLHGYFCRSGNGGLQPGYRASIGAVELLVLEVADGAVKRVGLEMPRVARVQSRRRGRRAAA